MDADLKLFAELVELAEASLALGDADAALQLLAQVDEDHCDNRWIATQVEALRLSGQLGECLALATSSLERMVIEEDWPNGRRLVLECGRVADGRYRNLDSLVLLHDLEVMLRVHSPLEPLFGVQLCSMIASRICWEGDLRTASHILHDLEPVVTKITNRRALANYLWVTAEISAFSGDCEAAISSMERVIVLLQEEGDYLAVTRAVQQLAWFACTFIDVSHETLLRALERVQAVLAAQPVAQHSIPSRWLALHLAHLKCLLGEPNESLGVLTALEDEGIDEGGVGEIAPLLDENALAFMHEVRALCAARLGDSLRAKWHLEKSLEIYKALPEHDAESRTDLRRLAHIYFEIGELATAQELIERSEAPQIDLSSYLPKIALGESRGS